MYLSVPVYVQLHSTRTIRLIGTKSDDANIPHPRTALRSLLFNDLR
jgi:hypothetical protein